MEQKLTGKFIQQLRKEKGLSQRELAEKINVSDKTVSRWETGYGLPDPSVMIPLASVLDITVNELLSGKRLKKEEYNKQAETNMVELMRERTDSKTKLILELIILITTILSSITLIIVAGYLNVSTAIRVVLIVIGFLTIIGGCSVACVLEYSAGYFECPHCKTRFKPSFKTFLFSMHVHTSRYLKCPNCKKKSMCKKTLTK